MKRKIAALLSAVMLAAALNIAAVTADAAKTKKNKTEYEIGSTVQFGAYEQDNDFSNGVEPIDWTVLDVQDEKVLLISNYALDTKTFNEQLKSVSWETCTLRSWLNEDFLTTAFSDDEQKKIAKVTVTADKHPVYGSTTGKDTKDKIFLLSMAELQKYYGLSDEDISDHKQLEDIKVQATAFAEANGAFVENEACWWWMRTLGLDSFSGTCVNSHGGVYFIGDTIISDRVCVRPALWLKTK